MKKAREAPTDSHGSKKGHPTDVIQKRNGEAAQSQRPVVRGHFPKKLLKETTKAGNDKFTI